MLYFVCTSGRVGGFPRDKMMGPRRVVLIVFFPLYACVCTKFVSPARWVQAIMRATRSTALHCPRFQSQK